MIATERVASITSLRPHPANPRITAAADDALVESIRSLGLIDSLLVVPDPTDPDAFLIVDGHRRFDGCQRAGLTEVPVRVRDDLVTEAQQVELMAVTGLQKENLSPVEEARAYEQLALLGMDEAAIATSTGFPKARVKQRLRLTGLPQKAQHTVHLGQATLGDVEAFTEFADDPTALAAPEETIGTDEYRLKVNQLRSRRARATRHAEIVAGFEEIGAKPVDPDSDTAGQRLLSDYRWLHSDLATAEGHDGCLGYIDYGIDSYAEPALVCTDLARHTPAEEVDPEAEAAAEAARQAEAAAYAEAQELRAAAAVARLDWLRDHYTALFPVKGNTRLVAALRATLPVSQWNLQPVEVLAALEVDVPAETPHRGTWGLVEPALTEAATRAPARLLRAFARLTAAVTADGIDDQPSEHDHREALAAQATIWGWLVEAGYPMTSIDTEIRDTVTALLAEKSEESEDVGGDQ